MAGNTASSSLTNREHPESCSEVRQLGRAAKKPLGRLCDETHRRKPKSEFLLCVHACVNGVTKCMRPIAKLLRRRPSGYTLSKAVLRGAGVRCLDLLLVALLATKPRQPPRTPHFQRACQIPGWTPAWIAWVQNKKNGDFGRFVSLTLPAGGLLFP
eukprot:scaffold15593_cov21-Tisochrysis_lutea.AAC.1